MSRLLDRLLRSGRPILYLTARPEELPSAITHVLHLTEGRATAQGPKARVLPSRGSAAEPARVRWGQPRPREAHPPRTRPTGRTVPTRVLPGLRASNASVSPLVELKDVTVRYGETVILHHVHWRILRGEQWALQGPNGAGKTTLLSLILGDHPQAYANEVRLLGRRLGDGLSLWELRETVTSVSSDVQVHHPRQVTLLETVLSGLFGTLGLHRRVTPRQRQSAREWLRRFRLLARADTPFGAASASQQRLALLARALIKRPRLLILDEPCQGLDPLNRRRMLRAIERLGEHPRTQFIFVTHQPEELPRTTTHLLRLRQGRVVFAGPSIGPTPGRG